MSIGYMAFLCDTDDASEHHFAAEEARALSHAEDWRRGDKIAHADFERDQANFGFAGWCPELARTGQWNYPMFPMYAVESGESGHGSSFQSIEWGRGPARNAAEVIEKALIELEAAAKVEAKAAKAAKQAAEYAAKTNPFAALAALKGKP